MHPMAKIQIPDSLRKAFVEAGRRGGKATRKKLSAARRTEIARTAGLASGVARRIPK